MTYFGKASLVMLFQLFITFVTAFPQQLIVVGPNVHVSKSIGNREHNEVILAANPKNPNHLLAASMVWNQEKSNYNVVTYVSFDGGLTWNPGIELNEEEGANSDPAVAIGCEGTAYLASLSVIQTKTHVVKTYLHRSKDGGKKWIPGTVLGPRDREYLIVDCAVSRKTGGLYMYSAGGKILYSEDEGQTFLEARLPSGANRRLLGSGTAVILSDGSFVVTYPEIPRDNSKTYEQGEAPIVAFRLTDGGKSFTGPFTVSKSTRSRVPNPGFPNLAADLSSGPFRDRIYAVWVDASTGRSQIMLAHSTDRGEKWSEPIVLNDDQAFQDGRKGPENFMGGVAVNRDGVVGVTWYDRGESRNSLEWRLRFTASFDGGESFVSSIQVSDPSFTRDFAKPPPFRINTAAEIDTLVLSIAPHHFLSYGGDTAGLVADAQGIFHPLWVDRRTGIAQVWTSAIRVNRKAVRNGDTKLQNLEDITQRVSLRFRNIQYDPKTQKVTGMFYLVNTSNKSVTGPVMVRILGFRGGRLQILNSDNQQLGPGAIWNYTSALSENKIKPGEKGEGKRIEFRVTYVKELSDVNDPSRMLFPRIRAKVLGNVEPSADLQD